MINRSRQVQLTKVVMEEKFEEDKLFTNWSVVAGIFL